LVQFKQEGQPVAVAGESPPGIGRVHRGVQPAVGLDQVRGHGQGIVEGGQGGLGIAGPGVKDPLGRGLDGLFMFIRGRRRPGEVVVDDAVGILMAW